MLTKDDLQEIRKIVKETVDTSVNTSIKASLDPIKKTLKSMNRKLDLTISYFDNVTTNHGKRIKRLETHVGLIAAE